MKNKFAPIVFFAAIVFSQSALAQEWAIRSADFDPKGLTKVSALKRNIKVDTDRVFQSKQELDEYIVQIKQKLINARLFESVQIDAEESEAADDEIHYPPPSALLKGNDGGD